MLGCCSDGEHYPYGTSLSFENDMIDATDVGSLNVGDLVEIKGLAFVDSKSEHTNKERSEKSMRIQFTSIAIQKKSDKDNVKKLYGDNDVK